MLAATTDRFLELEGSFNFRDLGGYRGAGDRTVRWRRLFRADGLHRLTEVDLASLAEVGLRTVIDLRTVDEVDLRGRIAWPSPSLGYHHLPLVDVLPDRKGMPSWIDTAFVAARYREMLARGTDSVAEVFAVLTDPSAYPAVLHCAAGKDRTGIVSALVLGLLGVADEDIVADYALSQEPMRRMLEWLRTQYPDSREDIEQNSAAIVAAEPETMTLFLQEFRAQHGSFEEYAASLGMASAVTYLREALLEPARR